MEKSSWIKAAAIVLSAMAVGFDATSARAETSIAQTGSRYGGESARLFEGHEGMNKAFCPDSTLDVYKHSPGNLNPVTQQACQRRQLLKAVRESCQKGQGLQASDNEGLPAAIAKLEDFLNRSGIRGINVKVRCETEGLNAKSKVPVMDLIQENEKK